MGWTQATSAYYVAIDPASHRYRAARFLQPFFYPVDVDRRFRRISNGLRGATVRPRECKRPFPRYDGEGRACGSLASLANPWSPSRGRLGPRFPTRDAHTTKQAFLT